jgi:cell filamentation protein
LLAKLMAAPAGVRIGRFDALVEERREDYFAAVRAGLDRNYSPMSKLFSALIDDETRAEASRRR